MRTTDARTVTGFSPDEATSVGATCRPAENSRSTTLQTSCHNHRGLLERIVAGLRELHDTDPIGPFQTDLPIRNYAQPDQAAP